jgi:hypothetical protein
VNESRELHEARERFEKLTRDVKEMDDKLRDAANAVQAAKDERERKAAKARVEALQKEQAELKGRFEEAKKALEHLDHERH